MLGEESNNNNDRAGGHRRTTHSRSVSWTDRSPVTRKPPRPLQPLAIHKRSVLEWPSAGCDDLGDWSLPPTPRGSTKTPDSGSGQVFQFKKDYYAFYDKECSRIAEHVYLGSDTVAKSVELLRRHGITHVLNCVGFVCPEYFKTDFVYKTLWLRDSPSEDITSILYDVFDYFEDVRNQGGRVFVHCCQGVSRSTSLVIAYLMWREGQSFEDAFHYVKIARGVTNPNMGFACQLLQCQKRVHAMPASPSSVLRMYRMAPHSPYDPLHLVPKLIDHPSSRALDSRGAFVVHVPNAIYVWIGKECGSVMCCNARSAAAQVVRYERATEKIVSVFEDEEPKEFWIALSTKEVVVVENGEVKNVVERIEIDVGIRPRRVEEYDLDFGIFHKALAGGVVPPFSLSNAGSENCLPARENGWGRLTRKLASGIMKGLFTSSKCCESSVNIIEEGNQHKNVDPPLPPSSNNVGGSWSSFECFVDNGLERGKDSVQQVRDQFVVPSVGSSMPPPSPHSRAASDSFACFLSNSSKFSSKSPPLSPASSDYASSFTFSPSSTDLSIVSSRQSSPSGLESAEPNHVKDASSSESRSLVQKEGEAFLANHTLVGAKSSLPRKGSSLSIAERRGSNPPPRMMLPLGQ
ncbi:protein-tyrosine-phosphatase MKP1-like [Glycine soja]|uniref:Protein-tyrosine-phosphatase MKP1 n=1 Tax=Glycine soja TaxID=3848 RepID=A0A445JE48_GLYSO|nr:protein-tyrosine-phosphatase MKP1-like [Glycine soja]RZB96704.1 Protein-tyrosine-phosphatase MKP1 [Glycine soja]